MNRNWGNFIMGMGIRMQNANINENVNGNGNDNIKQMQLKRDRSIDTRYTGKSPQLFKAQIKKFISPYK